MDLLLTSLPSQFQDIHSSEKLSDHDIIAGTLKDDTDVSNEGVTKLLKGLNLSKVLGSDELHPRVLKELATELSLVFAHLFQKSLDMGEIPKEWSLANICPLYKKRVTVLSHVIIVPSQ